MTVLPTTCTIERTFSILQKVETWFQSTMDENHSSVLCMLSVNNKTEKSFTLQKKQKMHLEKTRRKCNLCFVNFENSFDSDFKFYKLYVCVYRN